jgi:hypothetical protein
MPIKILDIARVDVNINLAVRAKQNAKRDAGPSSQIEAILDKTEQQD